GGGDGRGGDDRGLGVDVVESRVRRGGDEELGQRLRVVELEVVELEVVGAGTELDAVGEVAAIEEVAFVGVDLAGEGGGAGVVVAGVELGEVEEVDGAVAVEVALGPIVAGGAVAVVVAEDSGVVEEVDVAVEVGVAAAWRAAEHRSRSTATCGTHSSNAARR